MRALQVLLLLSFFPSCNDLAKRCRIDRDCDAGTTCAAGLCALTPPDCAADEARACGPAAVGACRPGVQHCVHGTFEPTCSGAILPTSELCNGVDDDCDGEVDEGLLVEYVIDSDGDGFGSTAPGAAVRHGCNPPPGFVANRQDCDDARAAVSPLTVELCDVQGLDENCDGRANDGCTCPMVGISQACCAGRGTQRCEAADGGPRLTSCSVIPAPELCNGVDDNCDGQIDEAISLYETDGGLARLDGGFVTVDGGCFVGVGACARSGRAVCVGGAAACDVIVGSPTPEVCNGLDDDCDGEVDEASSALCPTSTQSCVAGVCACSAGQTVCGSSCATVGGSCSVGTGACVRNGLEACEAGAVTCSARPGAPDLENCNGIDDDCDGQVDEAGAGLCAVAEQTCVAGACACAPGHAVCGSTCAAVGSQCTVGVGACARNGAHVCRAGALTCGAAAGPPRAEVCNGFDDDCDGEVDEAATGLCAVASQLCNAGLCTCPAGQSLCGASCVVLGRACGVGVGACHRSGTNICAEGARVCSATAGTASAEVCNWVDDDCDGAVDEGVTVMCLADADRDGYADNNVAVSVCPETGGQCPDGWVSESTSRGSDCRPNDPNLFRVVSTRTDSDADWVCTGSIVNECVGVALPTGRRVVAECTLQDDCNDGSFSVFQWLDVRDDADSDGACAGPTVRVCVGQEAPVGRRRAGSCGAIDDCRDTNPNARSFCTVGDGYMTTYHLQTCPNGVQRTGLTVAYACPLGFYVTNLRAEKRRGDGACSVVNETMIQQSCNFLEGSDCHVVGDCTAW